MSKGLAHHASKIGVSLEQHTFQPGWSMWHRPWVFLVVHCLRGVPGVT